MTIENETGREGGEYRLMMSGPAVDAALGQDGHWVLGRVGAVLEGLAALRSGRWAAGTAAEREPGARDWEALLSALAQLGEVTEGVTAAAIREHAAAGGSLADLARTLGQERYQAQRERERRIGVRERPVEPGAMEQWAREGGHRPVTRAETMRSEAA